MGGSAKNIDQRIDQCLSDGPWIFQVLLSTTSHESNNFPRFSCRGIPNPLRLQGPALLRPQLAPCWAPTSVESNHHLLRPVPGAQLLALMGSRDVDMLIPASDISMPQSVVEVRSSPASSPPLAGGGASTGCSRSAVGSSPRRVTTVSAAWATSAVPQLPDSGRGAPLCRDIGARASPGWLVWPQCPVHR